MWDCKLKLLETRNFEKSYCDNDHLINKQEVQNVEFLVVEQSVLMSILDYYRDVFNFVAERQKVLDNWTHAWKKKNI